MRFKAVVIVISSGEHPTSMRWFPLLWGADSLSQTVALIWGLSFLGDICFSGCNLDPFVITMLIHLSVLFLNCKVTQKENRVTIRTREERNGDVRPVDPDTSFVRVKAWTPTALTS